MDKEVMKAINRQMELRLDLLKALKRARKLMNEPLQSQQERLDAARQGMSDEQRKTFAVLLALLFLISSPLNLDARIKRSAKAKDRWK